MKHPEEDLQRQLWQAFQALGVTKRAIVFHPPNGGARSKVEAAIFKGLGVAPGVADFIFLMPDLPGIPRCACMELKAPKGRMSEHQKAFGSRCEALDIPYVIVRSLDEGLDAAEEWGLLRRTRR